MCIGMCMDMCMDMCDMTTLSWTGTGRSKAKHSTQKALNPKNSFELINDQEINLVNKKNLNNKWDIDA